MIRRCSLVFVGLVLILGTHAQFTRYVVRFKNKGATTFTFSNPLAYLSQRSIDRRTKYNIALDSADLPVPLSYINQVKNIPNLTVLNASKWMNAVDIQTSDPNAITAINALPFVQSTAPIAARISGNTRAKNNEDLDVEPLPRSHARVDGILSDFFNYGTGSFNEIHLHKGEFLHDIGLRGQGMLITVLDGGFFSYNTLSVFDSANINGQILSTWDFVNREVSVTEDDPHGMMCLSTIVANIPGQFIGKAPKASFHLFRTEDTGSEYPIEEFNWVCGAERADSVGTDIITSSLGYTTFDNSTFDHTYSQMNGNTTISTMGADLAAKKGILVFNAAGNDGTNAWHYIDAPSDADSVVAVGAVNTSGSVASFSSYGPSFDGRVKPDVASIGVSALVATTGNSVGTSNGTSFATPNMAGLATCLWQGFPEVNNMRIVRALKESGNLFSAPNDRIGYGVPDMKLAFATLLTEYATSGATINNCTATITWNSKDVAAMKYEVERKAPGDIGYTKIADVSAQNGSILATHSYSVDNSLSGVNAGTVSYRIRQIIDTTTASFTAVYIDTANASLASACTTTGTTGPSTTSTTLSLQPNPTKDHTTLVIESPSAIVNMPVSIYNMEGALVLQMNNSKSAGKKSIDLPTDKLPPGKYIIKVYDLHRVLGTTELLKL